MTDDSMPPLSPDTVKRVFAAVAGRAVVVAGQAVAWWAEYYGERGRVPRLDRPVDMYVSKDIDLAPASIDPGELDPFVQDLRRLLPGRAAPKRSWDSLQVAGVVFRDEHDKDRDIELLRELRGVSRRERIIERAVEFTLDDGDTLRVMDPVTLFKSRVANVAEVERYQKPKGVLQALVAGDVCAEWILDQLANDGWDGHPEAPGFATARGSIKAVCRLAESKNGVAVATRHGVDILRVVPPAAVHPGIPEQLYTVRLPRIRAKIAAVRAAMAGALMEMPARPVSPAVGARPGAQSGDKCEAT